MQKKLFVIFLAILISNSIFGLTLKMDGKAGKIDPSQVGVIELQNTLSDDFAPGENNFSLPSPEKLDKAGLNSSVDKGALQPGINVYCQSSSNTTWVLQIQSTGFQNTQDPTITIPVERFQWAPVYAGVWDNINKVWLGSDTDAVMASSFTNTFTSFNGAPQLVYKSNSKDTNHSTTLNNFDGTKIQIQLGIIIPDNQKAGTYEADLLLTLTTQ